MAFSDKIRFRDDESRRIEAEWAEQFKKLSGYDWPPQDAATWTIILTNAGFSQQRIEQFLNQFGHPGFEDAGDPPCGYISAGNGGKPTFAPALVAGLERWRDLQQKEAAAGDDGGESQPAGLDRTNVAVLFCLSNRAPALQTLDDIVVAAKVSRDSASKSLNELIADGLACRPKGERKGATVTDKGRTMAEQIRR